MLTMLMLLLLLLFDGPSPAASQNGVVSPCTDSPEGWTDILGRDCNTYFENDLCIKPGTGVAGVDHGITEWFDPSASLVCCKCGGGITEFDPRLLGLRLSITAPIGDLVAPPQLADAMLKVAASQRDGAGSIASAIAASLSWPVAASVSMTVSFSTLKTEPMLLGGRSLLLGPDGQIKTVLGATSQPVLTMPTTTSRDVSVPITVNESSINVATDSVVVIIWCTVYDEEGSWETRMAVDSRVLVLYTPAPTREGFVVPPPLFGNSPTSLEPPPLPGDSTTPVTTTTPATTISISHTLAPTQPLALSACPATDRYRQCAKNMPPVAFRSIALLTDCLDFCASHQTRCCEFNVNRASCAAYLLPNMIVTSDRKDRAGVCTEAEIIGQQVFYTTVPPTSSIPSLSPMSSTPTNWPSTSPTSSQPSWFPTNSPSSSLPTETPTFLPSTRAPVTDIPSLDPSLQPTTASPTIQPSQYPSPNPTEAPTVSPTGSPSTIPTVFPTKAPSSSSPTHSPTSSPLTSFPSLGPSYSPSTTKPSEPPTFSPATQQPSTNPTWHPSNIPTMQPSRSGTTQAPAVSSIGLDYFLEAIFSAQNQSETSQLSEGAYQMIILGLGIVVLLLGVIIILICRTKRRQTREGKPIEPALELDRRSRKSSVFAGLPMGTGGLRGKLKINKTDISVASWNDQFGQDDAVNNEYFSTDGLGRGNRGVRLADGPQLSSESVTDLRDHRGAFISRHMTDAVWDDMDALQAANVDNTSEVPAWIQVSRFEAQVSEDAEGPTKPRRHSKLSAPDSRVGRSSSRSTTSGRMKSGHRALSKLSKNFTGDDIDDTELFEHFQKTAKNVHYHFDEETEEEISEIVDSINENGFG